MCMWNSTVHPNAVLFLVKSFFNCGTPDESYCGVLFLVLVLFCVNEKEGAERGPCYCDIALSLSAVSWTV